MGTKIALARYLWEISRELPGSWKQKKKFLLGMKCIVRDYVTENPNADYQAIVKRFGVPRKIAESYVTEIEAAELLKMVQIRQRLFCAVLTAIVIMATVWCGFTTVAYIDHFLDMNGYLVVGEAEIVSRTVIIEKG